MTKLLGQSPFSEMYMFLGLKLNFGKIRSVSLGIDVEWRDIQCLASEVSG